MVRRLFLNPLVVLLLLSVAGVADDRGKTLETLLAERRQLHEIKRQEEVQSRSEFRHLERMIQQKEAELTERASNRDAYAQQVETRASTVKAEQEKNRSLSTQIREVQTSLINLLRALDAAAKQHPLLLDDAGKKRLSQLLKDSQTLPVHELTSRCMALMLTMSASPTTCQVSKGTIRLQNNDLHVSKLRIGSVAVMWMTRDRSRCGFGAPTSSGISWSELPASELKVIQHAFAVAKEDKPAEVLLLPLPGGAVDD